MLDGTGRIPTFVVTGFLGSGKTTLLRGVLHDPAFANTAVIVNEFGTVGLDHELLAHAQERTILMPGGCVCCSIREDVETTLRELLDRVDSGTLPRFDRLVIETTGLADPVPLLFTLHASPLAAARLRLESVIVTADGALGRTTLDRHAESTKQITVADRIVITKRDMAEDADVTALVEDLKQLNPWAEIECRNLLTESPIDLFVGSQYNSGRIRNCRPLDYGQLGSADGDGGRQASPTLHLPGNNHHTGRVCAVRPMPLQFARSAFYDHQTNWTGFGIWLTATLHRYGGSSSGSRACSRWMACLAPP